MYSQFSNCSTVDLNTVNLVFSTTGIICCVISAVIIVLIVLYKAYYTVLQRLFLYLMVSILLRELFIGASLEHHFKYDMETQDKVCTAIGFIWNWTGILVFIFTVGTKVHLFVYVKRSIRERTYTDPVCVQTRCGKVIPEIVLSNFVLLSLCYAFVPFFTKNYGLAGPWCWIRAINENCTISTSGLINQILNGYVFYISGSIIGLVLLIGIAVLYCYSLSTLDHGSRLLLKKTFVVIITFVANIVITVFALLTRVTAGVTKHYDYPVIWYAFAVTFPISMLLFPIVYMICLFRKDLQQSRNQCSIQNPNQSRSPERVLDVPCTNNATVQDENKPLVADTSKQYGSMT